MIHSRMQVDPPSTPSAAARLDSWKEIAAYLRKGVRTVQRWERTDGLPVRRHGQGSVFAYKSELDAWWQAQSSPAPVPDDAAPARELPRRRWRVPAVVAAVAIVPAILFWMFKPAAAPQYRPVPLTADHGWETQPSFSPDGRQIAYTWARLGVPSSIYVLTIGASAPVRLTTATEREIVPAWSPDGRSIAFFRMFREPVRAALIVTSAGGGAERTVAELGDPSFLSWSPDSQWLLFVDGPLGKRSIVALSVTTGEKRVLTEPFEFGYFGAGLSPDMRTLVFGRAAPGDTQIYEQSLGPGLQPQWPMRRVGGKVWLRYMAVASDARQVIYTSDSGWDDEVGVWRLRLTRGAQPELIYTSTGNYSSLAISRDGRRLAFAVSRNDRTNLWKLPVGKAGAEPSRLLGSTHSDLNPQYSPDGTRIAFHSTRSGASDLWLAASDGTNLQRLTFTNARTTATPRWSPDGQWIAFESNQTGQTEVYVVSSSGGPLRRLTDNPAVDAIPEWSRDGRSIYFCSDRTGRFEVWKMPAAGGDPVQVTHDGGFSAVESRDGKYLYYSQRRNFGPVIRVPLAGGPAEEIIPDIRGLFYAVSSRGIYFQTNRSISFWDSATRRISEVLTPPVAMNVGLAISPDDQTLLYTQTERESTDLYMIDGLR